MDALQPAVEREPFRLERERAAPAGSDQAIPRRLGPALQPVAAGDDAGPAARRRAEAADSALADDPHMAAAYDAKIYAAPRARRG